jgi:hypothetical protein
MLREKRRDNFGERELSKLLSRVCTKRGFNLNSYVIARDEMVGSVKALHPAAQEKGTLGCWFERVVCVAVVKVASGMPGQGGTPGKAAGGR